MMEKKKEQIAVIKKDVILDLIQDLQRLSLPLKLQNNARGRWQIKSAMTSLCNRAFTLIELLVVVLIIGILAAVAVPQYQVAVEKARLAEALNIMSYAQKMVNIHFLEYGNDSEKWRNASEYIELPGFHDITDYDTEHFVYSFDEQICAFRRDPVNYDICILGNAEENYWQAIATDNVLKTCASYSSIGNKICKSLEKDGYKITLYEE